MSHQNPDVNAKFIALAVSLVTPIMTQSDYDKLRDVADVLNPDGEGYVKMLNDAVRETAPFIEIR